MSQTTFNLTKLCADLKEAIGIGFGGSFQQPGNYVSVSTDRDLSEKESTKLNMVFKKHHIVPSSIIKRRQSEKGPVFKLEINGKVF
ncbi:MAG: hypothetical protein ACW98D_19200 [Promethearchaeota archaeon]|jgi:hypothetical protein